MVSARTMAPTRAPMLKRAWLVVLVAACGAGDGAAGTPGEPLSRLAEGDSLPNLTRPAAYAGPLPCADCSGIETTLVLHPDGSYRIRERYVGERAPNDFVRIGRWSLSRDSVPRLALYTDEGPRPGTSVESLAKWCTGSNSIAVTPSDCRCSMITGCATAE